MCVIVPQKKACSSLVNFQEEKAHSYLLYLSVNLQNDFGK